MKPKISFILLLGLIIVLGLSACSASLAGDITPPPGAESVAPPTEFEVLEGEYPANAPDAVAGQATFVEKCAPCHGVTGLGDGPDADKLPVQVPAIGTFDVSMMASPIEWFSMVTLGNLNSFMPPFSGSLDEQDRWDVLSYIYGFSLDESILTDGENVYLENCSACHGVEGRGDGPDSDDAADFTDAEKMVNISAVEIVQFTAPGMGPEWHAIEDLNMDQYFTVAGYIQSLVFTPSFENTAIDIPQGTDSEEPVIEDSAADDPVTEEPLNENGIETMTLSGMIFSGHNVELPEDLTVQLLGFDHFEQNLDVSTEINEDGSFVFEDIEVISGMVIFANVEFGGATYGSDFVQLEPGVGDTEVSITIFETTTDKSNLIADRLHIFFVFDTPDIVQVVQVWLLSNIGDKTITPISETEPVLLFDLPHGAQNLVFENDELGAGRFIQTDEGFGDLQPILPGQGGAQVVYAFEMPYDKDLTISQNFDIPIDDLVMFIPSNDIEIKTDNIVELGIQDLNGLQFRSYGVDQQTGSLEVSLKGSHPSNPSGIDFDNNSQSLIIGIVGFSVVVIGVVIWWRRKSSDYEYDEDVYEEDSASIVDEIIALDKSFENGDIDEEDYQTKRQILKEKLQVALDEEN
ncbi:MAG: c-type cytochrome [Chloroflexi bacterium]|jgi:mono/diheme cytochrome c family protein|nr:c-type cytochrome [Chloroflexota bacterium]MBT3669268.1 c-type cytochrome [Chloroflexota bacterium]MBT4003093.1 c-type cytochrome [Chloroflexota bacterium]MBT4305975.1 c-type cytochrome [Chloroflexota bacterium]MBT4683529.1 c-type cytochrome [Chloroflexota bacterium]